MNQQRWLVALILIAISPYATWARAEKVYKCGSTYSQIPCPGSTLLDVDDRRDPAEKQRMDAQTRRDADLARDMAQTRLANEAALAAERTQQAERATRLNQERQQTSAPAAEPVLVVARKPRLYRPHKPKAFIAEVPGTDRPAAKSPKRKPRQDDRP